MGFWAGSPFLRHKNWSYYVSKSSNPWCWACSVGGNSSAGQRSSGALWPQITPVGIHSLLFRHLAHTHRTPQHVSVAHASKWRPFPLCSHDRYKAGSQAMKCCSEWERCGRPAIKVCHILRPELRERTSLWAIIVRLFAAEICCTESPSYKIWTKVKALSGVRRRTLVKTAV